MTQTCICLSLAWLLLGVFFKVDYAFVVCNLWLIPIMTKSIIFEYLTKIIEDLKK